MVDNIMFAKLVSGETIIGIKDEEAGVCKDVVLVQAMPTHTGSLQIAIVPFGFPFEDEVRGSIRLDHVVYEYKDTPADLANKYVETKSNIKIAGNLGGFGGGSSDSGLIL
ncbi:hypothetical protein [Seleniivibrio sp.]|uniref:hypothetical protein n=1 Tax=Seleniivibrio sp. TaxID=2898801 RepID=UPI0025CE69DC|nr:hypothetical protein [Seleniivibrio sp.]MCD8553975.1 hypothetical protein [Seleniivibrio sp.]